MDISKARCPSCEVEMKVTRMACTACGTGLDGDFEVSSLARLPLEDQVFVVAFVRSHGHIKRMESLFGISYPTVKNRLNAIAALLDRSFEAPSPNLEILEQLSSGEIGVDEALERLR